MVANVQANAGATASPGVVLKILGVDRAGLPVNQGFSTGWTSVLTVWSPPLRPRCLIDLLSASWEEPTWEEKLQPPVEL